MQARRRRIAGILAHSHPGGSGPADLSPVRRCIRGYFAMRYRPFRNADPPALVVLWNESLSHRGAVELRSHTPLESAVFNKPSFDPQGFIVAEDESGRIAGFAHAGFGPNDDETALNPAVG